MNLTTTTSLQELQVGDKGRVIGFTAAGKLYRKKLLSMGLTRGADFSVTRYAPMGDPVEIQVRGYSLSLRKKEAAAVLVERR